MSYELKLLIQKLTNLKATVTYCLKFDLATLCFEIGPYGYHFGQSKLDITFLYAQLNDIKQE